MLAYAKNIEELSWEYNLYKILLKNYPKLESITSIQLFDEFETHEFLNELFPKN